MSEHAPGPWTTGSRKGRIIVIDADCNEVCEAYAGAALIAAAPELLAQLENLCRLSVWNGASDYDRAQVEAARAAIAKATGG